MAKSTASAPSRKALNETSSDWEKPYPDFPLSYHPPSGRLYKKIKGRRVYFGYAKDWQEALDRFLDEKDDLYAGRNPRPRIDGVKVRDLCNRFRNHQERRYAEGEIAARTLDEYIEACDALAKHLGSRAVAGLRPEDFRDMRAELAKGVGLPLLKKRIVLAKSVFRYALKDELIDRLPPYGHGFDPPSGKAIKREQQAKRQLSGQKMFTADEIRLILDHASPALRAMILLGVNAGFGNADCGSLPIDAVDLENAWVEFPRVKTGIDRRIPLWPETIEAIKAALAERPEPKSKDIQRLAFITKYGSSFAKYEVAPTRSEKKRKAVASRANPISQEFRKLVKAIDAKRAKEAKENGDKAPEPLYRAGCGFYALRHVCQTIGDGARDPIAVRAIMGHVDPSMGAAYREFVDDAQLIRVTDHIRQWLFGDEGKAND